MPKKLTWEEIEPRFYEVHGQTAYDYSNFVYEGYETKGEIKCNTCQFVFPQSAHVHLAGHGCPKCSGNLKKTNEQYIQEAEEVHGKGRYIYPNTQYTRN